MLEGFKQETPVSELCRRENISSALYYSWLKDFMEAGKERLKKDYQRDATQSEVKSLRNENARLKGLLNVRPSDVYAGRKEEILRKRQAKKQLTLENRKRYNLNQQNNYPDREESTNLNPGQASKNG